MSKKFKAILISSAAFLAAAVILLVIFFTRGNSKSLNAEGYDWPDVLPTDVAAGSPITAEGEREGGRREDGRQGGNPSR